MTGPTPLAAIVPIVIVALGWVAYCFVDIVKADRVRTMPKWAWALVCVISVPIGGILYLVFGRDR